ncbi:MAG: glycosyltransferase 87 family protein [Polyangiales bacterium]
MTERRRGRHAISIAIAVQGILVLAIPWLTRAHHPPSTVVAVFALCFIPYAVIVTRAPDALDRGEAVRIALVALSVFGVALVLAPPSLSDDVYRYVWEGRLWREGWNPYLRAPLDPALAHLRDEGWASINNKPLASIYPPLSQALFVLTDSIGGGVTTLKALALLGHLAATAIVGRISEDPRAPLALGLNPLLLSASALDGHLDILTGLALLIAAWGLGHHRVFQAAVATLVAVGLKMVGLVFLPLFLRRPIGLAFAAIGSALMLLPMVFWRPAADAASGTTEFATRWVGNESGYALLNWVSESLCESEAAPWVARGIAVGLVLAVGLGLAWRGSSPLRCARIVLWSTLLLSPQVHPWYLAWLLPIEIVSGGRAGLVWSAAALCAYVPLDRWMAEGVWEFPPGLHAFEYAAVAVALWFERRPGPS